MPAALQEDLIVNEKACADAGVHDFDTPYLFLSGSSRHQSEGRGHTEPRKLI